MTNHNRPDAEDPQWIIQDARAQALTANDEDDLSTDLTLTELWADALFKESLDGSAVVQAAADALIPPAEVSAGARTRFIAAAARALTVRRATLGLLPVALVAARRAANLTVEDLQQVLSDRAVTERVEDLEAGRCSITRLQPNATATWIYATRIDRQVGLAAARRSLEADLGGELRPAAGALGAPGSVDSRIDDIAAALDALERGTQ